MHRFRCLQLGLALLALGLTVPAAAQPFDEPDPMGDPMADPMAEPADEPADVPFGTDPATEPQPAPADTQPTPAVEPAAATDVESLLPWVAGASYITQLEWGIDPQPDPAAGPFEFHGYLRSTFGVNGGLGSIEPFSIPLAASSYPLGNDDVTYGEAQLVSNWSAAEGGPWFRGVLTAALSTDFSQEFGDAALALREAYVQTGNVLTGSPEMSFWAGQRYYRRHEVHINDFYFFSASAYGGGLQDVAVGPGKLAVSYFGHSEGAVTDNGQVTESNIDVRLYQVAAGSGFLQAGLNLALAPGGEAVGGGDAGAIGAAVDGSLLSPGVMGGYNKVTVEVGTGPARDFGQYSIPAIDESNGAWRLRVTDTLLMQQSPGMSLLGTFIFQYSDDGDVPGSDPVVPLDGTWVSIGARPIFHLGTYTAIATEAAIDYLKPSEGDQTGFLGKLTVAPTIRGGSGFWARPELRAFVTAAFWNEDIQGAVGGPAAADDTFGLSFGVQAEHWW